MTCGVTTPNYGDVPFIANQGNIVAVTEAKYLTIYLITKEQERLHSVSGFDSLTQSSDLEKGVNKIFTNKDLSALVVLKQSYQSNYTAEKLKEFLKTQKIAYKILDVEAVTINATTGDISELSLTRDLKEENQEYYMKRVIQFCTQRQNTTATTLQIEKLAQKECFSDEESEETTSTRTSSPDLDFNDDHIPLIIDLNNANNDTPSDSSEHTTLEENSSPDEQETTTTHGKLANKKNKQSFIPIQLPQEMSL